MGIRSTKPLLIVTTAAKLAIDPDGHLPFKHRLAVFKAITEWSAEDSVTARHVRGHLALLIAKRISTILPNDWPCKAEWTKEFNLAVACLSRGGVYLSTPCEIMWTACDDWAADSKIPPYALAGCYCCARALRVVAADADYFDDPRIVDRFDSVSSEAELDPWTYDTALLGSIAVAKGWPGEIGQDRQERISFWQWYLNYAIFNAIALADTQLP
jgi:Immunity protein Imm5